MPRETVDQHEVPTCMNGITTGALSRGVTQRICCSGEEAGYPQLDGKTLCTFTTT